MAELGQGYLREKGLLPALHSQHFSLASFPAGRPQAKAMAAPALPWPVVLLPNLSVKCWEQWLGGVVPLNAGSGEGNLPEISCWGEDWSSRECLLPSPCPPASPVLCAWKPSSLSPRQAERRPLLGGARGGGWCVLWDWASSSSPCWSPVRTQKVTGCLGEEGLTGCHTGLPQQGARPLCHLSAWHRRSRSWFAALLGVAGGAAQQGSGLG